MACYLLVPSHNINQCWLVLVRFCGMQLRVISLAMLKLSQTKMQKEIALLKSPQHLLGANDFKFNITLSHDWKIYMKPKYPLACQIICCPVVSVSHVTKGLWAHNPTLENINIILTWKVTPDQVALLHMSWQLSCQDMWNFVKWWDLQDYKHISKENSSKISIISSKTLCKTCPRWQRGLLGLVRNGQAEKL